MSLCHRPLSFGLVGLIGLVLAACNPADRIYIREGIGTNLATDDLTEVSRLQDIYVGEICRQAGLRVSQGPDGLICDEVGLRPGEWATFVQAGMNDIDRRCDAYLGWLDDKRRWREPVIKQLGSTAAATGAVLGMTGVGVKPIALVATAFGLAQESFVNFHSRLITEIDQTVVQQVVLGNQNAFRMKLANDPVNNRPAAIYLLRNYLRICMPFSIEMSISSTITTYHRAGPEGLARNEPVLTQGPTVARVSSAIDDVRTPLRVQPRIRNPGPTRLDPFEESLSPKQIREFQIAMCVTPSADGLGPKESVTRKAIAAYLKARGEDESQVVNQIVSAFLDEAVEKVKVRSEGTCAKAGFSNSALLGASFARPQR